MAEFSRTQEIAHEIGATGRFVLRVTSSDVEIRGIPGDTARVRISFEIKAADESGADQALEHARFRVEARPGSLEVSEPNRNESGGLGAIVRLIADKPSRARAETIVVEVPRGAHVAVSCVSSELVVSGLVGTQEYRTVSGDAVLTDVSGEMQINSVSGDVSLRGVGPIGLRANAVSGDLSAFSPHFARARVSTVSGDVDVDGELASGGEHRFDTVSGDLTLGVVGGMRLEVRGLSTDVSVGLPHRAEGSRDRRRYVIGDGGAQVVFTSMSGDAVVGPSRRFDARPPTPPASPTPPEPPQPPEPLEDGQQLEILRALEAGEIDVEEASRRLAGGPPRG